MQKRLLLTASLLLCLSSPAFAAPKGIFGTPLNCQGQVQPSALVVATDTGGITANETDGEWAEASMARIGYPARLPTGAAQRNHALVAAGLLQQGYVVAAKMVHDESIQSVIGYKAEPFAVSFEALMTVVTQPVRHASYPTAVRAHGEVRSEKADHVHSHGVDIELASASLDEIVVRVGRAQKALGETYKRPAVRYYILANAFRDPIAAQASTAAVCAENLSKEAISKLNVSARYVAMPSLASAGQQTK